MDRQAVFNTVRDHLLAQGKRSSVKDTMMCLYRNPEGLKCAVGALIKDEFYSEKFNHDAVGAKDVQEAICRSLGIESLVGSDINFLNGLQRIHDNNSPEHWHRILLDFAKENGLEH